MSATGNSGNNYVRKVGRNHINEYHCKTYTLSQCQYSQMWNVEIHSIKCSWQHSLLPDSLLLYHSYVVNHLIARIRELQLPSVLMHRNSFEFRRSLLLKRRLDTLD